MQTIRVFGDCQQLFASLRHFRYIDHMRALIILAALAATGPAVASDAFAKRNACGANPDALTGLSFREVTQRCGPPNAIHKATGGVETLVIGWAPHRRLYVTLRDGVVVGAVY